MRRVLPIPIRQTEIEVADQSAKNFFVKVEASTVPSQETVTASTAAIVTVDMGLMEESARIVEITGGQVPHGRIGRL